MKKILFAVFVLSMLGVVYASQTNVTYDWDQNTETNITNYALFISTHDLINENTAQALTDGGVTRFLLTAPLTSLSLNVNDCAPVYARVTAINSLGLQSDFSDEVSTTTRQPQPCKPGKPRVH